MTDKTIPFTRSDLNDSSVCHTELLRNGRLFNAVVTRVECRGEVWTVKDFIARPWYVRFVTRLLLGRELRNLARLKGIDGVASKFFRIDRNAIAIEYIDGVTLGPEVRGRVTVEYLHALERLLLEIHRHGVVHLDIRGDKNTIIRPDGTPAVIDFQSGLITDRLPMHLTRRLRSIDMSGIGKKWKFFHPEEMGPLRLAQLEKVNEYRKFWILRGYFGLTRKNKK